MFILFGLVLAVVAIPLVLFIVFAGAVGRAMRGPTGLIVAAAIIAVLLGLVSGHHAAIVALVAVALIRALRKRAPRVRPTNPSLRQPPFLPPHLVPSALETAWSHAAIAARGDGRIATARARCAELLGRAAAEPNDAALADWAEVIRRRVPELVEAAGAAAAGAPASERAALAGELADALDRVGAEADARLATSRLAARDRFDTLRGYVRNRTATDRDWL